MPCFMPLYYGEQAKKATTTKNLCTFGGCELFITGTFIV